MLEPEKVHVLQQRPSVANNKFKNKNYIKNDLRCQRNATQIKDLRTRISQYHYINTVRNNLF